MRSRLQRARAGTRSGFALIIVLLVLLALLVLCAPFLLGVRNADRASTELADRVDTRLSLDAAARHARAVLGDTHPALDTTPYYDDQQELRIPDGFPEGFLDANDEHGEMWRAEARDVSGKIDLDTAPPQLFANLLGLSTRFSRPIKPDDKELPVGSLAGFEPTGMLWCDGELIHYGKLGDSAFEQFTRGVGSTGEQWVGGPRPPAVHAAGAPVLDQRAFAVPLWRAAGPDGSFRELDEIAALSRCGDFALARATAGSEQAGASVWDGDLLSPLFVHGSVYARARDAQRWMRPVRLVGSVTGGKDGRLRVESTCWISPGSTLQVYDGQSRETAIVVEIGRDGVVYLDRILVNDYRAWDSEVRVLARRPVNLNTAEQPVLEALFQNLQVRGRNARINKDEAATLAQVVIESRPLKGWEDFLRRVVLPACGIEKLPADAPTVPSALAAGQGFLDELDALALYRNGLNANDGQLAFSTLPFCFRSNDVYELELRATVNAESGVERFTLVRDEVQVIAPQRRLMQLWATQEDYDEELRLTGCAPFWSTAPNATSMFDPVGSNPPSRLVPHWGTWAGGVFLPGTVAAAGNTPANMPSAAQHVFASQDSAAWIQLWPARVEETGRHVGRMLHFDTETHDPEGRYLPDEPVVRAPSDKLVGWVDAPGASGANSGALMLPPAGALWIKPRSYADACLLDVAGGSAEADRIGLFFERGDLVLRAWDGTGDHPATSEAEVGEAHYAFAPGTDAPGLPLDVWSHVAFDVRGTRPDQLTLLVNGKTHGVRRFGLTRLASAIDPSTLRISVESVAGFPAHGVARIGDELVEYTLGSGNMLDCTPIAAGTNAGFGGRMARERTILVGGQRVPEILFGQGAGTQAPANVGNHPSGTTVEVFGYSMPLRSNAPSGESRLPAQLGAFAVGIVSKAVTSNASALGERLQMSFPGFPPAPPVTVDLGFGMDGNTSTVTALEIKPADSETSQSQLMSAFNPGGGWLLVVQHRGGWQRAGQGTFETAHHAPIGGMEFIWYSGVQGNQLLLNMNRRGNTTGFKNTSAAQIQRAFVVDFDSSIPVANPDDPATIVDPDTRLEWEVFVFPVSLPAPGASSHFLDPRTSQVPVSILQQTDRGQATVQVYRSEYAQITEGTSGENTEWVRYDEIGDEQLVRTESGALYSAYGAITRVNFSDVAEGTLPVGPPPGVPGSPGSPGSTGGGTPPHGHLLASPAAEPQPAAQTQTTGSYWNEEVGAPDTSEGPITRSTRSFLQFRGVLGTFSHAHAASTPVLPVVRVVRRPGGAPGGSSDQAEPDAGRPGVDDPVFFVEDNTQLLGNPARVQRAYIPYRYRTYHWKQSAPTTLVPIADAVTGEKQFFDTQPPMANPNGLVLIDNPVDGSCVYVGLREALPTPYPYDADAAGVGSSTSVPDIRKRYRMTKHPSGERPRVVSGLRIGGALVSSSPAGAIPSALADEIVFGGSTFGTGDGTLAPESGQGAQMWLTTELAQAGSSFTVDKSAVRLPADVHWNSNYEFLNEWPADAGLLQIGDELLCYSTRTPSSGAVEVAVTGRGLLGTRPQPHHAHEGVQLLDDCCVSVLAGELSATAAELPLASVADFPSSGLVLIDDELIHYTHLEGNTLVMPRASSEPGKMDRKGGPLFRGRFGTTPAGHSSGTPVILFPFRYWDRWAERADAPELAHFDLALDQPSAWWESCFFMKTDTEGSQIGVLERDDPEAPWDADPDQDKRLALYWKGDQEGAPLSIGKQSDSIRWRVFVKYSPDAFDPKFSLRHGWRQTPRLERLGAFYYAPDAVLRSVER